MSKLQEEQGGPTKSVILCGIEAHACIYHTAMDLLEKGDVDVHVVADCCSSRSETDRMITLQKLRDMGAFLTTCETVILGLAADAKHPKFRDLQKLVMESGPDTGLFK
jgi:nicotinamidase-related amidase